MLNHNADENFFREAWPVYLAEIESLELTVIVSELFCITPSIDFPNRGKYFDY